MHCRIPHADSEAKTSYLSHWVDSHISDGDIALRKPVLFTEVGSSRHVDENGVFDRDVLLKTVYDKIYESAKKRRAGAGAGAFIWQLLVEGVDGYSDDFSFVPQDYPSTYKLIKQQSCRLQSISAKDKESLNRMILASISCK
ncbi:mannan endo-1,4-beta-mannosidase 6-like [Populus nigra]|uniref:mannan endo-1,4-beta-mannosidase 6-like n=1 Tax=Populus nigra TaxID=3691 RepID=UPI002B27429B|nr:mannan endo-1,4-beta-mannosidase 6-like [Populus nigra]